MKFTVHKDPVPYLLIEDVFEEDELQFIYRELEFLYPKLLNPDRTGSAKNNDGTLKKKNKGVFLDEVYNLREFSDILKCNRKFFSDDIYQKLIECSSIYGLMKNLNNDTTLISYYETSDLYEPHKDKTIITICAWFFQEPKNFTGGDFIFSDYNIHIPVKNNQAVIFFSHFTHSVSETRLVDESKYCSGRFTMSMFVNQVPKNDN